MQDHLPLAQYLEALEKKLVWDFVEETEKQVVKHLERHLDKVSKNDTETIEILKDHAELIEDEHAQRRNC